jgi:teichuronic acid biosynthesis glycosyltransferase TuaC
MRALYICWSYPSESCPAVGSFFRNQVEGLRDAGVDVTVIIPIPYVPRMLSTFSTLRRFTDPPVAYQWNGISVLLPRYIRMPHRFPLNLVPSAMARATSLVVSKKPDIVHGHFAYPYGIAATQLARRWKVPAVVTVHGNDGHTTPYQSRLNLQRFRYAMKHADSVLAVSNELVRIILDLSGTKSLLWPIGVDRERFRRFGDKRELRVQLGLPVESRLVLFVGELLRTKGIETLVQAASQLAKDTSVVVVGDGPYREIVRHAPGCTWVPPVSNDDVPKYLNAADLMVLPTHAEGMPTVLVEAGATGLPVLATAVSSIPDLLADDRGLLIPPEDPDALVHGIENALQNREESAGRAERFQRYVAEHYDSKLNASRLAQLYRALITQSRSDEASSRQLAQPPHMAREKSLDIQDLGVRITSGIHE